MRRIAAILTLLGFALVLPLAAQDESPPKEDESPNPKGDADKETQKEAALQKQLEQVCADVSKKIEAFLGPKFKAPVPVSLKTGEEMAAFAKAMSDQLISEEDKELGRRMGVRMRYFPPDFDPEKGAMDMVSQQMAGMYNPMAREFFVAKKVGPPGGMVFQIVTAHELVHAYRHVDKDYFKRMIGPVKYDMDWTLALRCLCEGDAQLVGLAVAIAGMQGQPPAAMIQRVCMMAPQQRTATINQVRMMAKDMPTFLREINGIIYGDGLLFAVAVFQKGGLEALAAAYDQPPRSTEQVLHPAKYLADTPDEPTLFEGGDPTAALGEGWKSRGENVMGEIEMGMFFFDALGEVPAKTAAAGWDGCKVFYCEKPGEKEGEAPASFVGVISTWDTETDAREFAEAWATWASKRDKEAHEVKGTEKEFSLKTADGLVVIRFAGKDVWIADGVPKDRADAVFKAFSSATRSDRKADAYPEKREGK